MQADVLDRRPDNRKATRFRRKHIKMIGALPHIAEEAFNGIGGLNMPVYDNRKLVKHQGLLILFRDSIALLMLGLSPKKWDI